MGNFQVTSKGEKFIEKLRSSSETRLGDYQLMLLLTAAEGKLETTDITRKYGTIGAPIIESLRKKGLLRVDRDIKDSADYTTRNYI